MIFEFLAESICQPRKAYHRHSHCQILALSKRRVDEVRVRVAFDRLRLDADACGRAVAAGTGIIIGKYLDEHGVIGIEVHCFYRLQIRLVAVRGELHAIGQPRPEIAHKRSACVLAAVANVPRHDQLGVAINSGPRPNVARAFRGSFGGANVLFLGVGKTPNLVALNGLGSDVSDLFIMEGGTKLSSVYQQLCDGIDETPHTRETEHIDEPSTSMERIWTRFSNGSLFMPT